MAIKENMANMAMFRKYGNVQKMAPYATYAQKALYWLEMIPNEIRVQKPRKPP